MTVAEESALTALTMNRGLADLEPIERPKWATNLLPPNPGVIRQTALELLACARDYVEPSEELIAIKVLDVGSQGFIQFDLTLAIGSSGFTTGAPESGVTRLGIC